MLFRNEQFSIFTAKDLRDYSEKPDDRKLEDCFDEKHFCENQFFNFSPNSSRSTVGCVSASQST